MKTTLTILCVLCFNLSFSQKELKYHSKTISISSDGTVKMISAKPVTNKEYLTYIFWNMNAFIDFPDKFLSSIPGLKVDDAYTFSDEMSKSDNPFEAIFKNSPTYVKDYIFNPKYINHPVIGISWEQAFNYNKWLADRYNEYCLIKGKFYDIDLHFLANNLFVTESALAGQYEGLIYKKAPEKKDILCVPSFRIPIKKELNKVKVNDLFKDDLVSYKKDKNEFLKIWIDMLLEITTEHISVNNLYGSEEGNPSIVFKSPEKEFDIQKLKYEEMTLDEFTIYEAKNCFEALEMNGYEIADIDQYKDLDGYFIEKDHYGYMPYTIIGIKKSGDPIIISKIPEYDAPDYKTKKIFIFRSMLTFN